MRKNIKFVQLFDYRDFRLLELLKIFMIIHSNEFEELTSIENLLRSWRKFKIGKNKKWDVVAFERNLEDNLFLLYHELKSGEYRHSEYKYFSISDPKKRDIHKAEIRDRILHQTIFDYLEKVYEPLFISDSFSSRKGKGTHRAVFRLFDFAKEIRIQNSGKCFAIKCDVRKYFESISHKILFNILKNEVEDSGILSLIEKIIKSFNGKLENGCGIPLGNITSQIFANVYLNELDKFVKNELKLKHYLRYNDDFAVLGSDEDKLFGDIQKIKRFVSENLLLELPEKKTVFRKLKWGIDFCGYIILPNAILLRHKTKSRMVKNMKIQSQRLQSGKISFWDFMRAANSYFGLLEHCNSFDLKNKIKHKHIYGKTIRKF